MFDYVTQVVTLHYTLLISCYYVEKQKRRIIQDASDEDKGHSSEEHRSRKANAEGMVGYNNRGALGSTQPNASSHKSSSDEDDEDMLSVQLLQAMGSKRHQPKDASQRGHVPLTWWQRRLSTVESVHKKKEGVPNPLKHPKTTNRAFPVPPEDSPKSNSSSSSRTTKKATERYTDATQSDFARPTSTSRPADSAQRSASHSASPELDMPVLRESSRKSTSDRPETSPARLSTSSQQVPSNVLRPPLLPGTASSAPQQDLHASRRGHVQDSSTPRSIPLPTRFIDALSELGYNSVRDLENAGIPQTLEAYQLLTNKICMRKGLKGLDWVEETALECSL